MTTTFDDFYLHELQMLFSAEEQTIALLPRLIEATDTLELRKALQAHLGGCREQLSFLATLHPAHLGNKPQLCRGMSALLAECLEVVREYPVGNLRDTVVIARMQRADHYRMAAYGSLHDYAKLLGYKQPAGFFDASLKAVTAATKALGQIAIQVNAEAYVDTRIEKAAG